MIFSSTIGLTFVILESVNLISNVGFAELRGRTRQVWTFSSSFVIFNFVCLIVLKLFHPCNGSHEGETPTIVKVSST